MTRAEAPSLLLEDKRNGFRFIILMGMDAPESEDAFKAGQNWWAQRSAVHSPDPWQIERDSDDQKPEDSVWKDLRCQRKSCVAYYLARRSDVLNQLARRSVLMQRYERMMNMPAFEERVMYGHYPPSPSLTGLREAAELSLASCILKLDDGETDIGRSALLSQIDYHRRMLAASTEVTTKALFMARLQRDYETLSEVLERWPALANSPDPRPWLRRCIL